MVLAVPYTQAPHAVRQHAEALDGRVVVDITNPVDVSVLEPLDTAPFGSGAEVIADVAPDGARVVKAFNTTFAGTLLAGAVDGRPLDVFLAGDDEDAKATVGRAGPRRRAAPDRRGAARPCPRARGARLPPHGGAARARDGVRLGRRHHAVRRAPGRRSLS